MAHTSGLPLTAIRRPLTEYKSIRSVAADAAKTGIDFKPGTKFQYSDAGSDTLGAIIASVTSAPPEDFIVRRIIEPLRMQNALVDIAIANGKDSRERSLPSAYSGGSGNWQRHWQQSDSPIYPLFLTSQSLYCATTDYAQFLTLWMDGGVAQGRGSASDQKTLPLAERPGRARLVTKPQGEPGKFTLPGLELEFESSDEPFAPAVIMKSARQSERQRRHAPDDSLPKIDEVIRKVRKAHGIDQLKEAGVVKLIGTMKTGIFGRKGKLQYWFDDAQSRIEIEIGSSKTTVITDGDKVFVSSGGGPFKALEGAAGQQETLGHPTIHYGGWRKGYNTLDVLRQVKLGEKEYLLVRVKTPSLPGSTILVDAETGLINGVKQLQFIPGMGFVGMANQYSDFREVGGTTLPFQLQTRCVSPLIGNSTIQFESHEVDVDATGLFDY